MGADVVERGQPLAGDRRGDLALADAVAAADFRIIRQGCNGRRRVQRRPSLVGLAENERFAHFGDIGGFLLQVVEPSTIGRFAVEHGPDNAVVLQHQPLVDTGGGVAQHDLVAVLSFCEIAKRKQIDAGDFQLGWRVGMHESGGAVAGQMRRGDTGHFVERRNETVDHAVDLGAFAEREDIAIGRLHAGIDNDAAIDRKTGLFRKSCAGPDAHRHDDEGRRYDRAVVEFDAFDLAIADDGFRVGLADNLDAAVLKRTLQQITGPPDQAGGPSEWG